MIRQGEDKSTNINMLDSFLSKPGGDSPKAKVRTVAPLKQRDPTDPRFILIPASAVKVPQGDKPREQEPQKDPSKRKRPSHQFSTQNDTVSGADADLRAEQPWLFQTEADSVEEASEQYRFNLPARNTSQGSVAATKAPHQTEEMKVPLLESVEVQDNSWNSRGDMPRMNISQIPIKIADETSEFSSKGLRELPLESNSGSRVVLSGLLLKSVLGAPSTSKIVVCI